jgi:hypothetical protein
MSELRADTITASDGTSPVTLTKQSAAKAWVFGDTSATLSASSGVSSGIDNATGDYSYNLTNAFGSSAYAVTASAEGNNDRTCQPDIASSSKYDLHLRQGSSLTDLNNHSAVHGDLA